MKKIETECDFGSRRRRVTFYLGRPAPGFHPLHFQAAWLRESWGGVVPEEVMEALRRDRSTEGARVGRGEAGSP